MIKEIQAKVLLSHVKQPDTWFGLKYNMNLYRGCQHRCIYCDSRSECYQIDNFDKEVLVKANAIPLLRDELSRKRVKGTIGLGSMNDLYMPLEKDVNLTGQALGVIAEFGFPVHIITKSDLVLRDLETLKRIRETFATVSFTITTADDALGKKVEPGAPLVSKRFQAIKVLSDNGIQAGITLMPVLPFIEDTEENITAIVEQAAAAGVHYILPALGMTLRDRQRAYYYNQLDRLFPSLRQRYQQTYGDRYSVDVPNAKQLYALLGELCERYGIAMRIPMYKQPEVKQLSLF
ncbi:MAG: radical SAM protein [Anaerolineae bacterium]|nr:radical SAM protein [Anaerolineae bacterium]